jgi:hypothetical protein
MPPTKRLCLESLMMTSGPTMTTFCLHNSRERQAFSLRPHLDLRLHPHLHPCLHLYLYLHLRLPLRLPLAPDIRLPLRLHRSSVGML